MRQEILQFVLDITLNLWYNPRNERTHMTRDQWKAFEESLHLAPEITREMYTGRPEMTQTELVDISRTLYTACAALKMVQDGNDLSNDDDREAFCSTHFALISGLYGRLMGLARAYDESITKQAVLEAELATTGK